MNRISQLFEAQPNNLLNVYFTAGYPNLNDTAPLITHLAEAGVDLIEVGIPYSDPLADGPTIQASSAQALANGMTLALLFEQLRAVRPLVEVPLILMGYLNPILQYGLPRFLADCVEAGVDGLIIPDLPLHEYQEHYQAQFEAADLGISFLVTPQTPLDRIHQIDALTRGFIYMVSSAAITGAQSGVSEAQLAYFERMAQLDLRCPRLIGFGISDHASYTTACQYASGAIIGSAFIRALAQAGERSLSTVVHDFVHRIRKDQTTTVV